MSDEQINPFNAGDPEPISSNVEEAPAQEPTEKTAAEQVNTSPVQTEVPPFTPGANQPKGSATVTPTEAYDARYSKTANGVNKKKRPYIIMAICFVVFNLIGLTLSLISCTANHINNMVDELTSSEYHDYSSLSDEDFQGDPEAAQVARERLEADSKGETVREYAKLGIENDLLLYTGYTSEELGLTDSVNAHVDKIIASLEIGDISVYETDWRNGDAFAEVTVLDPYELDDELTELEDYLAEQGFWGRYSDESDFAMPDDSQKAEIKTLFEKATAAHTETSVFTLCFGMDEHNSGWIIDESSYDEELRSLFNADWDWMSIYGDGDFSGLDDIEDDLDSSSVQA